MCSLLSRYGCFNMRPNLTNFKLMLDKQLERMSKAIEWFTDLATCISAEGATLKSKAVAKVELSTRLSYCANLPNTSQKVPVPASLELPVIVHEDLILESKSESKHKTKKTAKKTNTLESMLAYQAKQEDFEHV